MWFILGFVAGIAATIGTLYVFIIAEALWR